MSAATVLSRSLLLSLPVPFTVIGTLYVRHRCNRTVGHGSRVWNCELPLIIRADVARNDDGQENVPHVSIDTMTDEELSDVLTILGDEHAREILQATMKRPMSADELSDACNISPQSVYRRTDELSSYGLLETELEYDEDGHHFRTYTADPTRIVIAISEENTDVTISRRERMADRFSEFIDRVRDE